MVSQTLVFHQVNTIGSFKNHVDKMRWVCGRSNVHNCPCKVGKYLVGLLNVHVDKKGIMLEETNLQKSFIL